jgi:hypothetical protein
MRHLVCLAAVAACAVACGGGDDESAGETTSGPPPDRAGYIAEADAFCAEAVAGQPEIAEGAEELREMSPRDPEFRAKAAAHFRRVLMVAKGFQADFEAIEPPEEDRERIEAFSAANADAIDRLEDVVNALEGDADPSGALAAYGEALAKADRLGEAYGFEVCAQAPAS